MNLYKIFQIVNLGPSCFASAVVIAEDECQARRIHPYDGRLYNPSIENKLKFEHERFIYDWANPEDIIAIYLGAAYSVFKITTVICSDYIGGVTKMSTIAGKQLKITCHGNNNLFNIYIEEGGKETVFFGSIELEIVNDDIILSFTKRYTLIETV